jgi:hypothetical protein
MSVDDRDFQCRMKVDGQRSRGVVESSTNKSALEKRKGLVTRSMACILLFIEINSY